MNNKYIKNTMVIVSAYLIIMGAWQTGEDIVRLFTLNKEFEGLGGFVALIIILMTFSICASDVKGKQ